MRGEKSGKGAVRGLLNLGVGACHTLQGLTFPCLVVLLAVHMHARVSCAAMRLLFLRDVQMQAIEEAEKVIAQIVSNHRAHGANLLIRREQSITYLSLLRRSTCEEAQKARASAVWVCARKPAQERSVTGDDLLIFVLNALIRLI